MNADDLKKQAEQYGNQAEKAARPFLKRAVQWVADNPKNAAIALGVAVLVALIFVFK